MAVDERPEPPVDPIAVLESQLVRDYLAAAGYDIRELLGRTDDEARRILAAATRYAGGKLTEVEARAHYLHKLHGEE
ncbi:MAG TPA: hypothetical protein VGD94_10745 [Vicinamibacterales bacterium]